jgi:hypothetical protein
VSERYPTGMGRPYTPEPSFGSEGTLLSLARWVTRELERIAARIRATAVHTHLSGDVRVLTGNSFIGRGADAGQGVAADLAVSDTATVAWTFAASGVSAAVPNGSITLSKMATIGQNQILGRVDSGTGVVQALTAVQATTIPNAFVGDAGAGGTKGQVPAPAAGDAAAGKYLFSDGNWTVPTVALSAPTGFNRSPTTSFAIAAGYSGIVSRYMEVTEPMTIEIAATGNLEVLE